MKFVFMFFILVNLSLDAKYLDSETCKECHEDIYAEHIGSMHHKSSIFKDEVHRKMKEAVSKDKYACALCHMPGTLNLASMFRGMEKPNPKSIRQTDGVSCFYCHQISKVYHGKTYNINFFNAKNGEKPIMFGNLDNPDDSDKHNSQKNEIYKNSEVCMGCHSHKENAHGFQVCNTFNEFDKRSDCIKCHMPKAPGKVEKFNKKGRDEYATHDFLGIHSAQMVKKAVGIKLSYSDATLKLEIENKMGHSIIVHPMRLKFAKTVVLRDSKIIWSNFENSPLEDKNATFIIVFKDAKGKASFPHNAVGYKINQNLKAMSKKVIEYKISNLKKGDVIKTTWISYAINPKIAKKFKITDKDTLSPHKGVVKSIVIK